MRTRRGFALIFVLWVVVSVSALVMALSGVGRGEIDMIRRRTAAARAHWMASGCLERFRADAEEQIWSEGYTALSVDAAWTGLDRLISSATDCRLRVRPAGLAVDVNRATLDQLRRLFLKLDMSRGRADSLAAAIVDWRDADDEALDDGAEAAWYRERGRMPPRNGSFRDAAELALVRGVDSTLLDRGVLGVSPGRILWRRAEPAVLSTLPGMTDDALAALSSRDRGELSDLSTLVDFPELPPAARDSLARASRVLQPMIASHVESWTVSATALDGDASYVFATMRLGLRENRLMVLEWRLIP